MVLYLLLKFNSYFHLKIICFVITFCSREVNFFSTQSKELGEPPLVCTVGTKRVHHHSKQRSLKESLAKNSYIVLAKVCINAKYN